MKYLTLFIITLLVIIANCADITSRKGDENLKTTISAITNDTTTTQASTTPVSPTTNTTVTTTTDTTTSPIPPTTTTTTASTTLVPTTTTTTTSTEAPKPAHKCPQFSFLSFIGGIIMTIGLAFIGGLVFKFYKARTERNYHTL